MQKFSLIDLDMQKFEAAEKELAEMRPAEPWTGKDATENARLARIVRAEKSFWDFIEMYFSPDMYSGGYAKPSNYHKDIVNHAMEKGLIFEIGPRGFAKTAVAKQFFVWSLLTCRFWLAGTYAENLTKSGNILKDLASLIEDNERICHDYKPVFKENNTEQFQFRTTAKATKRKWRYVAAFSEGRSVRGFTRLFGRPQFLLGDDVETLQSSWQKESVNERTDKLYEAYKSLEENSTFFILGNDFEVRSAIHTLRLKHEKGLLAPHVKIYVRQAWEKGKSLWPAKYPAKTEAEMRIMVQAANEADWQGNFMANPIPPEGYILKFRKFIEYDEVPSDARLVLYTDPNLALKGMGDTTGASKLGYSAKLGKFLLDGIICRSFSDPNDLLDRVLDLHHAHKKSFAITFDGWVNQESAWTNNVRNWGRINKKPFPSVHYRRYHTDDLAKNLQIIWENGDLIIRRGLFDSEEGQAFLIQCLAFTGKKSNGKDDAPDSLICALEALFERKIPQAGRRRGNVVLSRRDASVDYGYSF